MLRVSVTTIEQYRRVIETDYASEEQLIAQIRGEPFTPTWQMQAGSAWDAILSKPVDPLTGGSTFLRGEQRMDGSVDHWYESGGLVFAAEHVAAGILAQGPGISQVKHAMPVETSWGPVNVVGKLDRVWGLIITDNKATWSAPDPAQYEQDLQWRFYLLMFGAVCFRYNIFAFKEPTPQNFVELKSIDSVRFWPYDALEADCMGWLNNFLDWAARMNLLGYLERTGTP